MVDDEPRELLVGLGAALHRDTIPPCQWSLRWYEAYLASSSWMQATATFFKAGALTTLVATPLGTMAAYGLFVSPFRWTTLIYVILVTPVIVPRDHHWARAAESRRSAAFDSARASL